MLNYYHKKLENEAELLVIRSKKLVSLDVTLYIKSGSMYENNSNRGISHLLEHLLFLKTKESKLNPIALDIYPYTRKDFTYFEINTHKDLLSTALDNLFYIINNPDFSNKNLEIVKNIVKEELLEFSNDPYELLNQEIDSRIYLGHSLGSNIAGSQESIDSISLEELRDWYYKYYQPRNMILSVVGDVSVLEVVSKVKFNKAASTLPVDKKIDKVVYPKVNKIISFKSNLDLSFNYLAFVFPTSGINSLDYIKFILLAEILNKKIRQSFENSGLLYDIQLHYHSYLNTGEFRVITACDKSKADLIIRKFNSFLDDSEITRSVFEDIKEYIKYQFALKEDNVDELSSLTLYLLKQKPTLTTLEDEIEQIDSLKFSELKKLKKDFFNKSNCYYFIMD